jgi:hypothetical protein
MNKFLIIIPLLLLLLLSAGCRELQYPFTGPPIDTGACVYSSIGLCVCIDMEDSGYDINRSACEIGSSYEFFLGKSCGSNIYNCNPTQDL